ncbi:MAG TPA: serine/threonine-protein kinase, partial [Gemmatimonadaceae bacterium]|nr:serine/threonine-protein kinase [Gemmatimonadaceae bacterium]
MTVIDRDRWRELEPLLDRALELSTEERTEWLDALRAREPELGAELASLLAHDSAAGRRGFLARPVELTDRTLEGMTLGAYTLERRIGQGGMGSVWLARRTDGRFEGRAAVKLLNLALLSAVGQERFRREGSLLARLTHPGIARLLDAGVGPGGQPYLVLEYVDGQHIDAYVQARGLPLEERVRLFLQVLAAVGHAHASLVVHRDLKPSNILVAEGGAVKLLDFGIAKLLGPESGVGELTALTIEGGRALTPEYAAPEQVRGDAVTTATDVYALGALLYLLVSGRHPTAEGCRTAAEAIRALLEVEPARIGLGDLDTVLAKALRKAPGERYQTVAALGDDIERYLRYEPVSARPHSLAYRARKAVRRNRAAAAATGVVAAALVGATVFSVSQMREARRQRDAALFAKKRADAQVEFQALLMSEVGDRPVTMRQLLDKGRAMLEQRHAGDPRFLATILVQMGEAYSELGDTKVQGELLARAESAAVAVGDARQLPAIRCNIAENLRVQGRFDDARRTLDESDARLRAAPDPESESTCLESRALLAGETGKNDEALRSVRRAVAIRDSLGETNDAAYIAMLGTLAEVLDNEDPRGAIAIYQRVIGLMDSTGRGGMITSVITRHNLAMTLVKLGELAEAERALHDVIEGVAHADPGGRMPTQPLIHYAQVAYDQRHADSARKYFAMLADQAAADGNSYWESRGSFGLAQAEIALGRTADARRTTERYRRVSAHARNIGHTDDHVLDARVLDGRLALAAGDTAAAHALVVEALRARGYFTGERTRYFHAALLLAAETAIALGHADSALAFAREARTSVTADALAETRSARVGEARLVEGR